MAKKLRTIIEEMKKHGEDCTYDRAQAEQWCYAKRAEGFKSSFTARKIGTRRLYTVRWFSNVKNKKNG